jgi:hypothetical protein
VVYQRAVSAFAACESRSRVLACAPVGGALAGFQAPRRWLQPERGGDGAGEDFSLTGADLQTAESGARSGVEFEPPEPPDGRQLACGAARTSGRLHVEPKYGASKSVPATRSTNRAAGRASLTGA